MPVQLQSGPGKVFLSQLITPEQTSKNSDNESISKISESLKHWEFNLALPIVCLSDEEDEYILLTGLPIYEAASKSGLEQIWVSLIAQKQSEAQKVIDQLTLQSQLNDTVIGSQDITDFLDFLNDPKSPLTQLRGVGKKYADKIKAKRPYKSQEHVQKELGPKQSMNWFKAYREWKLQKS